MPSNNDKLEEKGSFETKDPLTGGTMTVRYGDNWCMLLPHRGFTPQELAKLYDIPVEQVVNNIERMRKEYREWQTNTEGSKIYSWSVAPPEIKENGETCQNNPSE